MILVARALVALLLLGSPALAAAPVPAVLSAEDRALVARVEDYLNGVTTMEARFVQVAQGRLAEGRVLMARPGRMRIDYDPPVPVRMIANGIWVLYFDTKLDQTSYIPSSKTPLAFLLRERVRLDDKVTVTRVERMPGVARLSLVLADSPDAGELTVVFADAPLRLVKWELVDATGTRVEVALLDPRFGVALDDKLFDIADPRANQGRE